MNMTIHRFFFNLWWPIIVAYTTNVSAFSSGSYASPRTSYVLDTILKRPITSSKTTTTTTSLNSSVPEVIDEFYKTMPLTSAFVTCGIKASAADIVAQIKDDKEEDDIHNNRTMKIDEIETRRNVAFLLYGGLYQGMAQQVIFCNIFPRIFGHGTDVLTILLQVSFDMMVISPLLCLPVAYVVKSFVFNHPLKEAMMNYKDDVMNNALLLRYWLIWGPVQCCTFSVVPEHLRIVFIALVSFFWLVIFSSISNSPSK